MSQDPLSLERQAGDWLRLRGFKLVTAESCTGGLVGHRVTNVAGSSDYYLGGIIAYANEVKQGLLGVRPATLEQYGAVSQETVIEMAHGACQVYSRAFALDRLVGISVSGVAGPGGGSPEKPVGLVWIGLSGPLPNWGDPDNIEQPDETAARYRRAWKFQWHGDREENKAFSAQQALQVLLDYLRGNS